MRYMLHLYRTEDETGISGTKLVADGMHFDDGTLVLKWRGQYRNVTVFHSKEDAEAIRGHGGKAEIRVCNPLNCECHDDAAGLEVPDA